MGERANSHDRLRAALGLIVITDHQSAAPKRPIDIVRPCLDAGATAVQLRDKRATARELLDQAHELRELTRPYHALLFVNDRLDVALAANADGVHLGPNDLPLRAARKAVPDAFLVGFSTDEPDAAKRAEISGADYIGCGAVFGTTTKPGAADERVGTGRLDDVARAVSIPVVGIGGIGPENIDEVARTAATGAAVVRAIMSARDPADVTRRMLRALTHLD